MAGIDRNTVELNAEIIEPADIGALWEREVDELHYSAAPIFYGVAIVAMLCGHVNDPRWFSPVFVNRVLAVRVALALLFVLSLAAVRTRRARGSLVFGVALLSTCSVFGFMCGYTTSASALTAVSANFAVMCFLWPATFLPAKPVSPSVACLAGTVTYAVSGVLHSRLSGWGIVSSGGYLVGFFAVVSPIMFAFRYNLLRANFKLRAKLEQTNRRIADQAAELKALASFDGMTGAYNRRVGLLLLKELLELSHRTGAALTVVYIDVDGLKVVNDKLGHASGDTLIRSVANVLLQVVRASDVVMRLGGDEFALALPNCRAEQAKDVARRIDAGLAAASAGQDFAMSISYGFAGFPDDIASVDANAVLERADAQMYSVKLSKKGKTVASGPATELVRDDAARGVSASVRRRDN